MNTLSLTRGGKQEVRTRIRGRNETRTGDNREVRLMDKQCEQPLEAGMVRKGFLLRSSRKYAKQLVFICCCCLFVLASRESNCAALSH